MKHKTELLAPAKNKETAFAAIDCGADAVYIGAYSFGARQAAGNSLDDIKEVVDYAHKFWVKVFVTINTILTDSELEDAVKLVQELDKIGVDAILVQDMGLLKKMAELVELCKISVPIHMSTQCDNRSFEKVKFFKELGVSRVVLARELSLDKIKQIHKAVPDIELEGFVHGALCVSYSGQCYLSQYIGGRSANRGECAQPCRKKYTVIDDNNNVVAENIYPLCLKDFNASAHIQEMISSGIYSFKIEGRLKDISYVKNITAYYRKELDKYSRKSSSGRSLYTFTPNPEKSFNRGFTDYFLLSRNNCCCIDTPKSKGEYVGEVLFVNKDNSFTIMTDKEIYPQDGLCFMISGSFDGVLVNKIIDNRIYPNKKVNIKKGTIIYRNFDIEFEKEVLKPTKRQIGLNVEFKNGMLILIDEDGVTYSAKIDLAESAKNSENMKETFIKQFSKTGESDFYITDIKIASELPFMPISEINQLRRESLSALMQTRLKCYKREKQKPLKKVKYYINEVDYRANVHNKVAQKFYSDSGCEVLEPSLETKVPNRQIELMRTKHCIKYTLNMCKSPVNLQLKDEYGKIYPLKFDCDNCEMVLLSCN